ncbi:MAG: M28 family metallopeptidase [Acidobacteriota bacterium]
MRTFSILVVSVLSLTLLSATAGELPMRGFSDSEAATERALEARFDQQLNPGNLDAWMKRLSARPHHLGSDYDRENAEFLASLFKSWGYQTRIEEFTVLFPTPKTRVLEMIAPTRFTASLAEPPVEGDSTSSQQSEQLPTYNAYSIDGDVTAPLVYVNYGVPADYEELDRRGIDVKGKIAIARYGGSWRGIKPKVAAEHGAVGTIIYSDPAGDGYAQGDVYPKGPYRNSNGVQRGSVQDMPVYPGDPLTPGVGATKDAKRLAIKDAVTITRIPVMPISYSDAQPLLAALQGPMAPESWRGGLPISYRLGPGPVTVHLKVESNWNMVPLRDVIAVMPGSERPDEWIIRGNHHDAWVNGAEDPISGLVSLLEEARSVGELAKTGWKPKRTIVYAAWDGEEPGLIGSTEWAETHADELEKKAAVYINSDTNGRGFVNLAGSHTLERFLNEVARDVNDPEKNISVGERERARRVVQDGGDDGREAAKRKDLRIDALGSGSDYTPFLQHLGIASINLGYGGENGNGIYHSVYDSYAHYTRFLDPGFAYGIALAKTAGRTTLRLANASVLPFEFGNLADTIDRYVAEVQKLSSDMREETARTNEYIKSNYYASVSDPTETYVPPKSKPEVPHLNFAPLQNASERLDESARKFTEASEARSGRPLTDATQRAVDQTMIGVERSLGRSEGLPGRPWFRHFIYAPGQYTGYGVKTLPVVREAIEQRNWKQVDQGVRDTAAAIEAAATQIDRATELVK